MDNKAMAEFARMAQKGQAARLASEKDIQMLSKPLAGQLKAEDALPLGESVEYDFVATVAFVEQLIELFVKGMIDAGRPDLIKTNSKALGASVHAVEGIRKKYADMIERVTNPNGEGNV